MLSQNLQRLYNEWLISFRKSKNQPFKIRKNFDKFEESSVSVLERLDNFFLKFPNIQREIFFLAPYKVFESEKDFYPLDFYLTRKAVSCYTTYIQQMEMENPDSEDSMQRLKDNLKFVFQFCKKEGLTMKEYVTHLNSSEAIPVSIQHLKNHNVNFYLLHSLNFPLGKDDRDIYNFIIPNFSEIFYKTRNQFFSSKRMKDFSKKAIEALEEKLKVFKTHGES